MNTEQGCGRLRPQAKGRTRAVAAALSVLLASSLLAVGSASAADDNERQADNMALFGQAPTVEQTGEDAWKQQNPRSSAEQREQSQSAYEGLDRQAAIDLLEKKFPDFLPGPLTLASRIDGKATDYLGDDAVAVKAPDGTRQLVLSQTPFTVHPANGEPREPVNLKLTTGDGGYEPKQAPQPTEIPEDSADGVELGGSKASLVAGAAKSGALVGRDEAVLYPDIATDTDLIVRPTGGGLQMAMQLRSERTPKRIELPLNLPRGADLTTDPDTGGAVIRYGQEASKHTISITPPTAYDADGYGVEVHLEVSDSKLVFVTDRDDTNPAYPIIVDPQITDSQHFSGGTDATGEPVDWDYAETKAAYQKLCCTNNDGRNPGIYVFAQPATYQSGDRGIWYTRVPHFAVPAPAGSPDPVNNTTAYISKAVFHNWNFHRGTANPNLVNPRLVLGLLRVVSATDPSQNVYASGTASSGGTLVNPSGAVWAHNQTGAGTDTVTTTDQQAVQLMFEQAAAATGQVQAPGSGQQRFAYLDDVDITITDNDSPTVSFGSGSDIPAHGWVGSQQLTIPSDNADTGLGVKLGWLAIDGSVPSNQVKAFQVDGTSADCVGYRESNACPQSASTPYTLDTSTLATGSHQLALAAFDVAGNSASSDPATLRVDRTAPDKPNPSGPLAPGSSASGNTVTVDATDADSGVRSIQLEIDGQVVKDQDFGDCPDADEGGMQGNCDRTLNYDMDPSEYPSGSYDFEAIARDQVGNVSDVKSWQGNLDTSPEVDLSGALEAADQIDGANGNVVIDGPTKLHVEAKPQNGVVNPSPIDDVTVEVRQGGDPWQSAYTSQQDECDGTTTSCALTYMHFPERWGRGLRDIRVIATDSRGESTSKTIQIEQPEPRTGQLKNFDFKQFPLTDRSDLNVNLANGNLLLDERDIHIGGTGLDLGLTRAYNSQDDETTGEFGPGWSFSTGTGLRLAEESDGVRLLGPSGYRLLFEDKNDGSGEYNSPSDLDAKLTHDGDGYELRLLQTDEVYKFTRIGQNNELTLDEHRDKNGHKITFTRDGAGQLQTIVDTQGNYPASTVADHTLTVTHQQFGGEPRITEITDAAGRSWDYGYDSGGYLISYTNPEGDQTTYDYDSQDRLASVTDPLGNVTHVTYASQPGNPSRSVSSIQRDATDNDGDGKGGSDSGDRSAADYETNFAYDAAIGGNGDQGTCEFAPPSNRSGTQIIPGTVTDANGNETIYCNDDEGEITRTKDPRGVVYDRTYDTRGNVLTYARGESGSSSTDLSYDSQDRLSSVSTPTDNGSINSFVHEWDGDSFRPTSTTDPQGNERTMGYDTAGNLETVSAPDENDMSHTVIDLDRYDPSDSDYREIWKGLVRRSKVNVGDPDDPTDDTVRTRYHYNDDGDIASVQPPTPQGEIVYSTDTLNRISQITDANGVLHEYFYDDLDRLTEVHHESQQSGVDYTFTRYSYDADGNLKTQTDGERLDDGSESGLQTDTFGYDARNELTSESYRDGSANAYTYDDVGNLETLTGGSGTTTYSYNEVNLVNQIAEPGASQSIQLRYEHEGDPNPDSNNVKEIDFPGGTTKTYDYDRADRVTHIQASDDPSDPGKHVDLSWDYTVDEAGTTHQTALRQQMIDHKRDITTTYGYDYLGRLVSAEESGSGSDEDSWTYTYNEASELTESTHAKDGSPTITHTYEHRNSHEIKSRDGDTYTYDPQGNLTQIENGPTLSYNEANQTRQLDPASGAAVDFAYAGPTQADRRSRDEASGDQIDYLPNALGLGAQTLTPATGSPESTYFTRMPSGEPVAMRTPQGTDYYVSDSIGSIVAMVDNSGNLAGQYRYDPYGNTLLATEQTQNPYRYAGYYYDHPTGLYKAGERYYDPETGTWTQKDPISQIADPRQANPYVYAGADPVNQSDPSGMILGGLGDALSAVGDVATSCGGLIAPTPPIPTSERQAALGAAGAGYGFIAGSYSARDLGFAGVGVGVVSAGAGWAGGVEAGEAVDCFEAVAG